MIRQSNFTNFFTIKLFLILFVLGLRGAIVYAMNLPDLISWWEAENNANDSVGSNHGIVNGAVFEQGLVGQAFSFDGVDDFVLVPDAPSLDLITQFTLSAWINPKTDVMGPGGGGGIISKVGGPAGNKGYQFTTRNGPTDPGLNCLFNAPGEGWPIDLMMGNVDLELNKWSHVACTYDGNEVKIYHNGTLVGSQTVQKMIVNSSSNLRISGDDNNNVFLTD